MIIVITLWIMVLINNLQTGCPVVFAWAVVEHWNHTWLLMGFIPWFYNHSKTHCFYCCQAVFFPAVTWHISPHVSFPDSSWMKEHPKRKVWPTILEWLIHHQHDLRHHPTTDFIPQLLSLTLWNNELTQILFKCTVRVMNPRRISEQIECLSTLQWTPIDKP